MQCMDLITQSTAYTTPLHSTAQCIQEGTHRCCCCRCKSHHSDRGRLDWRGRRGQCLKNKSHVTYISSQFSSTLTAHYIAHTSDAATDMHSSHDIVMHFTHLGNWRKKAGISCPCLLLCTYGVECLVCWHQLSHPRHTGSIHTGPVTRHLSHLSPSVG